MHRPHLRVWDVTEREDSTRRHWTIPADAHGRLDSYVAAELGLSRSRVAALMAEGRVTLDGRTARKSESAMPGSRVDVLVPPPAPAHTEPEEIPLDIVYEDRDLVVVNKEAGLVVHPAPGHPRGTLVNALLHHVGDLSGVGGALRPGIVHRLDRDTSGLIVAAKSDRAHWHLSTALRERLVRRSYLTVLWGSVGEAVTVDRPIGRHPRHRTRMAVTEGGRPARTHLRPCEEWVAATLCRAELETGRTHQIRVHAAAIGSPVVGDLLYGSARERGFGGAARRWAAELARIAVRQMLHAERLGFQHPTTGEEMTFATRPPAEMEAVIRWARATSP